jgi:hypothetical protein
MIEELFVFTLIFFISLVLNYFVSKRILGPFYPFVLRLGYIGVAFHEVAHYMMVLAVGAKPDGIYIKWRAGEQNVRAPHGRVGSKHQMSFLQASVAALAPLYFSTWAIFLCLEVVFSPVFSPILRVLAGIVSISLLIGAAPSGGDLNFVVYAFRRDTPHSLYQIGLLVLSAVILWNLLFFSGVEFFLDVFYYLSLAGIYLFLKYGFIGIYFAYQKFNSRNPKKIRSLHMKRYIRRRYKPRPVHSIQNEYLGVEETWE